MPYAPIDEHFDEHPKFEPLELEHYGLMACALTYCNRNLTNGKVSAKAVRAFGASGRGSRLAARLVELGIWRAVSGGWEIVGYLDHNPSKEIVLAKREAARTRKAGQRKPSEPPDSGPNVPVGQTPGQPVGQPMGQAAGQDVGQKCLSQRPSRAGAIHFTDTDTDTARTDLPASNPGGAHPTPSPASAPDWFVSAIETVEMGTGETLDRPAAWIRYSSHREANGKPQSHADAKQWLVTVDLKEAKKAREQRRGRFGGADEPAPARDELGDFKV